MMSKKTFILILWLTFFSCFYIFLIRVGIKKVYFHETMERRHLIIDDYKFRRNSIGHVISITGFHPEYKDARIGLDKDIRINNGVIRAEVWVSNKVPYFRQVLPGETTSPLRKDLLNLLYPFIFIGPCLLLLHVWYI